MTEERKPAEALAEQEWQIYRACLPLQVCVQEIRRAAGRTEGLNCLETGASNGGFSQQLRRGGGTWTSIAKGETEAERVGAVLGENVAVVSGEAMPFENKVFDLVVVNGLQDQVDDFEFIRECHRVLKPEGRIVVEVPRLRRWSVVRLLRSALGVTFEVRGMAREGYTEPELFDVLKTGFDVHLMRGYSRFFTQVVEACADRLRKRVSTGAFPRYAFGTAGVFFQIADQLDMLLFMARGHRLIAGGKRRGWRSRNAPILTDGRSITEAVLSRDFSSSGFSQ